MVVVNPQVCFPSCNLVMGGGDAYKTCLYVKTVCSVLQ